MPVMKSDSFRLVVLSLTIAAKCVSVTLGMSTVPSPNNRKEAAGTTLKFDFGPGIVAAGHTQVLQTTAYSKELGYGFEPGASVSCIDRGGKDALRNGLCTSDKPFFFSVALPEGNYSVTITFGDQNAETITTVKAELRRLMLEKVSIAAG